MDAEAKFGAITSLLQEIGSELTPSHIARLVQTALEGNSAAAAAAAAESSASPSTPAERRDDALAEIVEQLPLDAQASLAADLLSSFNAAGLADTVHKIGDDAEGVATLLTLQAQALDVFASSASDPSLLKEAQAAALTRGDQTPEARVASASAVLRRLSDEERAAIKHRRALSEPTGGD